MRRLLFASCLLLSYSAVAQHAKPRVLYQRDAAIFTRLSDGFNPERLMRLYRAGLTLSVVRPNPADETLQDSVFQLNTRNDRLTLCKTADYIQLQRAAITLTKLSFGGMRIGISQADFCRRLHLNSAYDAYSFLRTGELFELITCIFAGGQLQRMEYKRATPADLSRFR